jgi:hypothetical protein
MRTGFGLPSCTYNIVLSEEDIKYLLEKGHILMRPERTNGKFIDDHGHDYNTYGHYLRYDDNYIGMPVQFVGIGLDYYPTKNKEELK